MKQSVTVSRQNAVSKRITVLFVLLLFLVAPAAGQNSVTITGSDSYNDSWNGAYISIVQNGQELYTFTVDNYNSPYSQTFDFALLDEVSFVWHSGCCDNECSFTIETEVNVIVDVTEASHLSDGQVITTYSPTNNYPCTILIDTRNVENWMSNASFSVYRNNELLANMFNREYRIFQVLSNDTIRFEVYGMEGEILCYSSDRDSAYVVTDGLWFVPNTNPSCYVKIFGEDDCYNDVLCGMNIDVYQGNTLVGTFVGGENVPHEQTINLINNDPIHFNYHNSSSWCSCGQGKRFTVWGSDGQMIFNANGDTLNSGGYDFYGSVNCTTRVVNVINMDTAAGYVTGAGSYNLGDTVILTAISNPGNHFLKWNDGSTDNPRAVVVRKHELFVPIFGQYLVQPFYILNDGQVRAGRPSIGQELPEASGNTFYVLDSTYPYYVQPEHVNHNGNQYEVVELDYHWGYGLGFKSLKLSDYLRNRNDNYSCELYLERCDELESLTFGAMLETLAGDWYWPFGFGIDKLREVTLGQHLTKILGSNGTVVGLSFFGPFYSHGYGGDVRSIETVNFNDELVEISYGAFALLSKLKAINLPASLQKIGNDAFMGCSSIPEAILPDGLQTLGNSAFHNCSGLKKVSIPYHISSMGDNVFAGCAQIDTLWVKAATPPTITATTFDSNLASDIPIIVRCGTAASYRNAPYWNRFTNFIEDSSMCGKYKVNIMCNSYMGGAIQGTADTIVDYGQTFTFSTWSRRDGWIFTGWSDGVKDAERTITVTSDTVIVAQYRKGKALYYSLNGPNTVSISTTLDSNAIYVDTISTDQSNLTIPATITVRDTTYTVTVVKRLYSWFCYSKITLPNTIQEIGDQAFYYDRGLYNVNVPNSVKRIGNLCFGYSDLRELIIGDSVTTIGNNLCYSCYDLKSITFGNSVRQIGSELFESWSYPPLQNITFKSVIPPILGDDNTGHIYTDINITVPCNAQRLYEADSIWGRFSVYHEDTACTRTITVASSNETQGSVSGGGQYNVLDTVAIAASAAHGYRFSHWNDSSTIAQRNVVVTGDLTFTAYFVLDSFNVAASVEDSTKGSVSGGGHYAFGDTVTLTATALPNYHFDHWSNGATDNTLIIVATNDTTFTAYFAPDTFTVAGTVTDNTMGSIDGPGQYAYGETATLTATPQPCYRFVQWNDGDTNNPRTLTVTATASLTAQFEPILPPTITASSANSAMGSAEVTTIPTCDNNFSAVINAIANDGFVFVKWNDNNYSNPRTLTVDGDANYTAIFTAIKPLPSMVPTNGLMAYYPFDGNAIDISGNGNHGVTGDANGGPVAATDRHGNDYGCYQFGGVDNPNWIKVNNSSSLQLDTAVSVSFWVSRCVNEGKNGYGQRANCDYNQAIIAKDFDRQYLVVEIHSDCDYDGDFSVDIGQNNHGSGHARHPGYTPCDWVHCVLTMENDHVRTYIDGVLVHDTIVDQINNFSSTNNADLYIGALRNGSWYPLNCKLDDLGLWNRALTEQEVMSLYSGHVCYCLANSTLTDTIGTISDGSGDNNYLDSTDCQWILQPIGANVVELSFTEFNIEQCCDHVEIYDGNSTNDPLIGVFSGSDIPSTIYSTGGSMLIRFTSDYSVNYGGWSATYRGLSAAPDFTVTAQPDDQAHGSVTGGGSYPYGSTATITATANSGYEFLYWDDGNRDNPRTVDVMGDTTFTAVFFQSELLPASVPADGLMAYYPFNGNAADISGNHNHGTPEGNSSTPAMTTDRFGNNNSCYEFGGHYNRNWITVPNSNSLHLDTTMTVSFWMQRCDRGGGSGWNNFNSVDYCYAVLAKGGDGYDCAPGFWIHSFHGQEGWRDGIEMTTYRSTSPDRVVFNAEVAMKCHQDCEWLHYVMIINGRHITYYRNGTTVLDTLVANCANFTAANEQDMYIGMQPSVLGRGTWYPMDGKLDDIGLWNRALTEAEVQQLYGNFMTTELVTVVDTIALDADSVVWHGNTYREIGEYYDRSHMGCDTLYMLLLQRYHTVEVTSNDLEQGTVTGGGTYTEGETITVTAIPQPCYQFSHWNDGDTNNPRTLTVTASASLTALFEPTPSPMVTVTSANNTMGTAEVTTAPTCADGSTTVTASPAEHYRFTGWSVNGQTVSTANPYSFTTDSDISLTANFELIQYTVTTQVNNASYGTAMGGGTYSEGSTATLTASPAEHYHFTGWSVNGQTVSTTNPYSFTVTTDVTLTAQFAVTEYTVVVTPSDPEQGSVTGGGTVTEGETITVTALPQPCYRFVQWSDGDTNNPRTLIVTAATSLTAQFELIPSPTVTATSANNAWGTAEVTENPSCGSNSATVSATEAQGYAFVAWMENCNLVANTATYSFTTSTDRSLTALFVEKVHDTTYIDVPYAVHDTTYIDVHDTTYVPVHDTTYIDVPYAVHDTTYIDVPYAVHDTTVIHDTMIAYLVHIGDTALVTRYVYDSTLVNHTYHDTFYVYTRDVDTLHIFDTMMVNLYQFDTTIVNVYQYDTTLIHIYDTTIVNNYQYDTSIYNHFRYDTTLVYDTMIVNVYTYDTSIYNNYRYDTVVLNTYQYDTTIVNVYDTTLINIYDTTIVNNYQYDTSIYNHFRYDTTLVYDTMIVNVYTYDTSIYNNYRYDTVVLNTYQYDTTLVNVYQYDTTIVNIYDTTINNHYQYDTVIVNNYVYDTVIVNHYFYDTTIVNNHDTVNNYFFDTVIITHYYHDTVLVNNYIFDTIYLNRYIFDTVWLHDTVVVHDTVYITQEGIDGADPLNAKVYASQGQIVVEGADGNTVTLYDVNGRILATRRDEFMPLYFDGLASGTYMVKIGRYPARKVVVIR